jgi:transcription initiation factor TFIIIB Brf1 subunit/transcription initiation factor TFIIB
MIRGELVCNECGLVLEENIVVSEARYVRYTSSDHNMQMSYSTENPVNPLKVKSHCERRLEAIHHLLKHTRVTQDVKDRAMLATRKYLRIQGKLPIHSLEDFVEAVVYLVSREYGFPYKAGIPMKTVNKVNKSLARAGVAVWSGNITPEHYLNMIIPKLGLGPEVKRNALEHLDRLNRFIPRTRAALSVVLALEETGEEIPIKKIAESAGISYSTLSKARKSLAGETKSKEVKNANRQDADGKTLQSYYFLERLSRSLGYATRDAGDKATCSALTVPRVGTEGKGVGTR